MPYQLILFDIAKGLKSNEYYNRFKSLHKLTREEIIDYQNVKLKKQIGFLYKSNKYFQKKLLESKINPQDITCKDDLKYIPPLERKDLQVYFGEMITQNVGKVFFSSSSGTTGTPVRYAKDIEGISAGRGATLSLNQLIENWALSNRHAHIWGNPSSVKRWSSIGSRLKAKVFNQANIDSTLTNSDDGLKLVTEVLKKRKPDCIEGYTSSIYNIALYVQKHSIRLPKLKNVITTGENLLPQHKDFIESILAPVSDFYGCGEVNGLAIRPSGTDRYYIADFHVVLEVVQREADKMKELLITDLDNKAFPLIRYKVGDMVDDIYQPERDEAIPFSHFKTINGRTVDTIFLPNGKCIQPINLLGGTLFREIGGVKQHKVIWNKNKLIFVFAVDKSFNISFAKERISQYLEDYEVDFEIEIKDILHPGSSGKFKYFEKYD
jgi:phenylacetate-CoA ligase